MNKIFSASILLSFMTLFFSPVGNATNGAVSSSMANTGRASVEVIGAGLMNPALVGFLRGYLLSSSYSLISDQRGRTGNDFLVTITDNQRDTIVPTSFMYDQQTFTGNDEMNLSSREFRLAFGNRVRKNWAFGLGFKYRETKVSPPTENYTGQIPERAIQTNADIGNVFPITPNLGFAVVVENILPVPNSIPEQWRMIPKSSVGFNYDYSKIFQLRVDAESATNNSFSKPSVGVGVQSYPNRWLAMRVGTRRNFEEKADMYSIGLGFSGPKFAANYAYNTSPQQEKLTRHTIDLELPLW